MDKWVYEISDFEQTNEALLLQETIFHNANGYIGVRANFEEGYPEGYDTIRGSYINGFYDIAEMKQAEKLCGFAEEKQTMLNVADSQGIRLSVDGEAFSMFEGTVLKSRRRLDMAGGYTLREIRWKSPKGKEVEIRVKRMTSFARKALFLMEYEVTALNFDGEIVFLSSHKGDVKNYSNPKDPRVAGESQQHLVPEKAALENGISYLVTGTRSSGLRVCTAVKNECSKECSRNAGQEGHGFREELKMGIQKGETASLIKYTVFTDSVREEDCEAKAKETIQEILHCPVSVLYKEQREYLDEFWSRASLEIEGDDQLAIAVRYNLYQLIQSVGKDCYSNIAAKGLSGEGYEGHYFWDTEMYIQPFFVLTNPEISKGLIEYRYSILDAARENAKILGHEKGAAFAWRTIMGKECSGYFPAGSAQYHISGDIAYSIVAYYLMTGDLELIAEKGAEIVFETARLWMDIGNYYEGTFRIHEVTGPDEYTCLVNNNYYTNVNAQYNLHWAVRFYRILEQEGMLGNVRSKTGITEAEITEFEKAEKNMYLPYDAKLGINPQDDSFLSKKIWNLADTPKEKFPLLLHYHPMYIYRYQVCKQADTVLAHFIFEDAQDLETIRRSFSYYEKITTHDSSLSTCIYSIVASKLGLKEKAYEYFGDSAKLDLFNMHHNTKDGIHTANMGGNYMAIVYGFAGLRIKETGICFAPALPEQWTGCKFRICYKGSRIRVEMEKDKTRFVLEEGDARKIYVYGKEYWLEGMVTLG